MAAGALVGGIGGGISGSLAGLVLGNAANAAGAAPILAGAAVGTAIGSIAGAAAGSLIFSGATTLGFVETDVGGSRDIVAASAQNIQQRTVQNSSAIRSFWSNIVSQSVQEEDQRIRTDRVTNHNRIHALNALYFEILNEYKVAIRARGISPLIFVPFKPIQFTEEILRRYWWVLRNHLADKELVSLLDQRFITLSASLPAAVNPAPLPKIESVQSEFIELSLNLDGSAMEDFVKHAIGVVSYPIWLPGALIASLHKAIKSIHIEAAVATTDGELALEKVNVPASDPNFIGRYRTDKFVQLHTITGIVIRNSNPEFTIGVDAEIPNVPTSIDVNKLYFENVSVNLKVRSKSQLAHTLPQIGQIDGTENLAGQVNVSANSSVTVAWKVGERLRDQFEGVTTEEQKRADEKTVQAKASGLLAFLNANKYAFTRLILQNTEAEQVEGVLAGVQIGPFNLSDIAGTAPLGYCGSHVVLPMKRLRGSLSGVSAELDTSALQAAVRKAASVHLQKSSDVTAVVHELLPLVNSAVKRIQTNPSPPPRDRQLLVLLAEMRAALQRATLTVPSAGGRESPASGEEPVRRLSGTVTGAGNLAPSSMPTAALQQALTDAAASLLAFLDSPRETEGDEASALRGYYDQIADAFDNRSAQVIATDEVSRHRPSLWNRC